MEQLEENKVIAIYDKLLKTNKWLTGIMIDLRALTVFRQKYSVGIDKTNKTLAVRHTRLFSSEIAKKQAFFC